MAGFGFARDAQKSFEQNRKLRQNKSPFQKIKENNFIKPPALKFKEASTEELTILRNKFLEKKRSENIRTAILTILVISTAFAAIWFLL